MERTKDYFIRMNEQQFTEAYNQMPNLMNDFSIYHPEQHRELMETDQAYQEMYSKYRKMKKGIEVYRFEKRHGRILK